MRASGTKISSILTLLLNVIYYFIINCFISRLLYKRNKAVNNWALISSNRASEAPFQFNILCIFIVLSPDHYVYYVSFRQSLSGVDLTVSERDLQSRSSSELLRWRACKVRSPSHLFFFFILLFFLSWLGVSFFYSFLISIIWGG